MKQKNLFIILGSLIIVGLGSMVILSNTISGQSIPSPINGVCGTLNGITISGFQTYVNNPSSYCAAGEFSNMSLGSTRTCKGVYNGLDISCGIGGYTGGYSPIGSNLYCGDASNQSFSTTRELLGDFYSNINNKFLGRLCENGSGQNEIVPFFQEDSLGWSWFCPNSSGDIDGGIFGHYYQCRSYRYQNAVCGISANTGHTSLPSSNLCAPGTVAGPVSFDNQTNLRSWSCSGNGGGNNASCSAWLNGPNTFAPMCNAAFINSPTSTYPYYHITSFPGSNACIYGTLSNRQISGGGTGTRQCSNNGQTSSVCGNVPVINASLNGGDTCNSLVNGKSFDNSYQLFQNNLCTNGGFPSSVNTMSDRRRWTCGSQTCESLMTTKPMCGRATQQPRRSHPTDGVCTAGVASTIKKSNGERGWICTTNTTNLQKFNNSSCTYLSCVLDVLDFYNGKTAVCTAPRIVDGQCKRQTQINTEGYSLPDDVLQAGLCEDGIPDTLIPTQDTVSKKWKWKCKAPNSLGIDSPTCYANVKLPSLPVSYIPQIINNKITSVVAVLTGFDPIYIQFDSPVNQYYKLFTQNGYFYFRYHDWAGNTGFTLAVVENIESDLPNARVVYNPSTPTSGFVTVSLTGFNRPQIPTISFTGSCLSNTGSYGTGCTKNSSIHPNLFTVTFRDNLTGVFTLTDTAGVSNTIPVAVTNIDRTAPTASIQYSNPYPTNTGVTAMIVNPSEPIIVTNNNGATGHYFSENGSFTFTIRDLAGNTSSLSSSVSWISKNAPTATVVYSTTGITQNNVVATLTNFSVPGTVVTNNSGQISYLFTHNTEFIFLLKDPAGNIGSIVAKVDNIDKPVASGLIADYVNKLCPQRTPAPVDTQSQVYNYHIQTVINNCIMKSQKSKNNYRYFYPRKAISRGEFITAVGRMITLTTQYSGSLVNSLSTNYLGSNFIGLDESTIGEADARGLLIYSPLQKNKNKRQADLKKSISTTEAQSILRDALTIMNNDTNIRYLIKNKGTLSKSQAAYAIATILSQYNTTALGNNHIFLSELNKKLEKLTTPAQKRLYTLDVIKKTQKTPSQSLTRLGIDPDTILQDLKSIALGTPLPRISPQIIDLQTSIDSLIRSNKPATLPTNNSDKTYNNNFFNFWEGL